MSYLSTFYRGHDVLTVMPNAWQADRDQVEQMPTVVVGDVGQWAADWRQDTPALGIPFKFFLDSRDTVTDFLLWFSERRGRYSPFWMPTWRRDLQLVSGAGASDTELTVYSTGYTTAGFTTEARRHLGIINAASGAYTVYPRRIEDAEDNGDGTETITLSSSLGVAVNAHAVVSFLLLCRLDADVATVHWHHPNLAEAEVRMVELPRQMVLTA